MKVKLYDQSGKDLGQAELPAEVFEVKMNRDLVHQSVVTQMANSRKTIAHTKDRSEVRGGGKKPWRQKGTGRARHGSIRSPIWKGGGVTFGPTKDRNWSKKINIKMKRKALFMALTSKVKDDELILLYKLEIQQAKTKNLVGLMEKLGKVLKKDFKKGLLIILPKSDQSIVRSSKNIQKVKSLLADSLNIVDVLKYKYLILLQESIEVIKKVYLK